MPYVQRDEQNNIIGKYACKQEGYAEEFLSDDAIPPPTAAQLRLLIQPIDACQIRLMLDKIDLRDKFEAAVATSSEKIRDEWQFLNYFNRDDDIINETGKTLGMTDEQLDQLFT